MQCRLPADYPRHGHHRLHLLVLSAEDRALYVRDRFRGTAGRLVPPIREEGWLARRIVLCLECRGSVLSFGVCKYIIACCCITSIVTPSLGSLHACRLEVYPIFKIQISFCLVADGQWLVCLNVWWCFAGSFYGSCLQREERRSSANVTNSN